MAITITNLTNHIEIAFDTDDKLSLPLAGLSVWAKGTRVLLDSPALDNRIEIEYTNVVGDPESAEALMDTIVGYINTHYSAIGS